MSNEDLNKNEIENGAEKIFAAKCRAAGVKVTPQREAIYRELLYSKDHPSAETLYHKVKKVVPSLSKDTLSRTLRIFTRIGAAFVVEGTWDAKRYDKAIGDHQHFRCMKCKKIIDFCYQPYENIQGTPVIDGVHVIIRKTVYVEGICERCGKENE
jgi:Fur family transcriptional regulator, peroxide stress response regulator